MTRTSSEIRSRRLPFMVFSLFLDYLPVYHACPTGHKGDFSRKPKGNGEVDGQTAGYYHALNQEIIMTFIGVKDLKRPRYVREELQREGALLLMNSGKPMAVMLNVAPEDDALAMLESVREARSRLALTRVREAARRSGSSRMSIAEIDREIARARAERRTRR
jgi:hypothetical protein